MVSPLKLLYEEQENPKEEEEKMHLKSIKKTTSKTKAIEPKNWRAIWDGIEKMRKLHLAAVDTMGCDQVHEEKASKEEKAYHTLVSLMLSSQTKDEVTFATTQYLVKEKKLSVETIV